jgi:hypothetical protein
MHVEDNEERFIQCVNTFFAGERPQNLKNELELSDLVGIFLKIECVLEHVRTEKKPMANVNNLVLMQSLLLQSMNGDCGHLKVMFLLNCEQNSGHRGRVDDVNKYLFYANLISIY